MTTGNLLAPPCDLAAEEAVIGCCLSGLPGYERAAGILAAAHFYKPAHRELFLACGELRHLNGLDADTEDRRIEEAARLTGVPPSELRRLVDDRPVMWDRSGGFARRVKRKASARMLMHLAGESFNRLGEGEPAAPVIADLRAVLDQIEAA